MNRRSFLRVLGGTGAAAAIGVPLLTGIRGSESTGVLLPSRRRLPDPFIRPLPIPPILTPVRSDATGDHYEITQRPGTAEILPGIATPIWGYDGMFPGPTIVATSGRPVVVRHRNELPVPVAVHLHGGLTPAESDGFPTDLLYPPGGRALPPSGPVSSSPGHVHDAGGHSAGAVAVGTRDYTYPMNQPAATLWYHDHRMDFTAPAVWRGLAGFHIVRDATETGLPTGDRDIPLMIADRSFDADGSLLYPSIDPTLLHTPGVTGDYHAGVLGDVILVNGAAWPTATIPRARHRLRLLNASNARRYRLALDPARPLLQIGTDGGLLPTPTPHDHIDLAPGQRCDVIVDFAHYPDGQHVFLHNLFDSGPTSQVMRFEVATRIADTTRVPDHFPTASPPATPTAVTRTFHFQRDNGSWNINGLPFSPGTPIASPRHGTTETWRLMSDFHHPIHVHAAQFEVVSRGLGAPSPLDLGPRDTIDLRPAEEVTTRVHFGPYPGRYVLHCHNLEHEDMAMMAAFTLT
ncbi:multicopper oxidase family protein [Actinoplanes sp. NPDC051851]|uniref:multicopper oxidase family protein n=1 Tax=Actinoplanes sp. NPDC051851 TaxID=3154753 RepID=UPI003432627C